jgi:acetyltransferase-like isoleucine patch superfamily enzyme
MIDPTAYIHPTAIVETDMVGPRTRIYAFVHILAGARIGADCNINDHCFIEGDVILGDRVTIKCGNYLWDGLRIEDDVFLGPNVVYTNDIHPRSKQYPDKFERIIIRKGASIGANSVLKGGITIGKYALIGMGSVVTKDVPDHALAYGNPARHHGYACECGKILKAAGTKKAGLYNCSCGLIFERHHSGEMRKIDIQAGEES